MTVPAMDPCCACAADATRATRATRTAIRNLLTSHPPWTRDGREAIRHESISLRSRHGPVIDQLIDLVDAAVRDDAANPARGGDVGERIAVDHDQIGEPAGFDRAG